MVKLIHQATQFLGRGCLPSLGFLIPSHCPCKKFEFFMEVLLCYLQSSGICSLDAVKSLLQTNTNGSSCLKHMPQESPVPLQLKVTTNMSNQFGLSAPRWAEKTFIWHKWGLHLHYFIFFFIPFFFLFFLLKTWRTLFLNASSQLPLIGAPCLFSPLICNRVESLPEGQMLTIKVRNKTNN